MYFNLLFRFSRLTNPCNGKIRTFCLNFTFIVLCSFFLLSSLFAQGGPWTTKADMKIPRYSLGVCEVNGKIYAIGGDNTGTGVNAPGSQAVEEYDPVTDTWILKENMPTGRNDLSLSVVNGKIYAIGGWTYIQGTGQLGLAIVEVYDPVSNTWETKTDMPTARAGLSTSVVNGKIYAFGGTLVPAWQPSNKLEVYDSATDSWDVTKTEMPMASGYLATSVVNDKIYVIGGSSPNGNAWSLNQEYDTTSDVWSAKSGMPYARLSAATGIINGKIYVIGGSYDMGAPGTSTLQEYDPSNDLWTLRSPMPSERRSLNAAVFDDKIYTIGGSNVGWKYQPVATVEEYNPLNDSLISSLSSIYEYQYTPAANVDPGGFANYKIYIPDGIDTLKGVYCVLPGGQQSSLYVITNPDYKAYVEEKDFALMGIHQIGNYWNLPLWSAEALILALKELSLISEHNELEFSPLLFRGYSSGANFSYNFTQLKPERVIAFVSLRGSLYDTLAASDASRKVPGYLIAGGNDETYRIDKMKAVFETHRPLGALWAFAIEPNKGHLDDFPIELMHSFIDEIIPMRIPEIFPADTIPLLKDINEDTGWLGNRDNYDINSYAAYSGDITQASWFPSQKIAEEWQSTVTNIRFRDPGIPEQTQLLQNYPNPFNPETDIRFHVQKTTKVILRIYNSIGKEIRTLSEQQYQEGFYHIRWNGRNNYGEPVPSGIYLYQLHTGNFNQTKKMILLK